MVDLRDFAHGWLAGVLAEYLPDRGHQPLFLEPVEILPALPYLEYAEAASFPGRGRMKDEPRRWVAIEVVFALTLS